MFYIDFADREWGWGILTEEACRFGMYLKTHKKYC